MKTRAGLGAVRCSDEHLDVWLSNLTVGVGLGLDVFDVEPRGRSGLNFSWLWTKLVMDN
jgi:hypothetical protein